jgi:transposase-like protein
MRHSPETIRQFLDDQLQSGQTVATFCADNDIKVPTFYSWKRKYNEAEAVEPEGFYKIMPKQETMERKLRLSSGLELSLCGLSIGEIAELVLKIDSAHA